MTIDEDTLVSYALGHLEGERAEEVERYLDLHPRAARDVRTWQDALANMVMELEPQVVPKGASEELLARVRAPASRDSTVPPGGRKRPVRPWWPWALAACLALVSIVPLTSFWKDSREQQQWRSFSAQPGAAQVVLRAEGGGDVGRLVRLEDGRVFVFMHTPPPDGRTYQAWQVTGNGPSSLGVFERRAFLSSAALPEGVTFALTLEPRGGSERPTTTPFGVTRL